ncbi:hypothetical protein [Candidatus Nitrospira salsa]|nr:MAG: hypothetical protein NPIRA01_05910 [Nitrospirales bacterium]
MKHLQSLIPKLSLSVVDQVLNSGGSFFIQVLLARWLSATEFGTFVVMFSLFLLVSCFSNGLILEPMSVVGASKYSHSLRSYLSVVVRIHFVLHGALSSLFLSILFILYFCGLEAASDYIVVAMVSPFILFFWLARRACYLHGSPSLAVVGSLVYTILVFLILLVANVRDWLSPFMAFLAMGISGAIAGLYLLYLNHSKIHESSDLALDLSSHASQWRIWIEHYVFGKWILMGAIPNWINKVSYIPLIGMLLGLPQAGAFRALQNLILPVQQTLVALGVFFLPWYSKNKQTKSQNFIKNNGKFLVLINAVFSIAYLLPLYYWGEDILQWLYQRDYYSSFAHIIPIFVVVALIGGLNQAWSTLLKAVEWSYGVFQARCFGAIMSVFGGWTLITYWGVGGAALGLLVSSVVEVLVLYFVKNKKLENAQQESYAKV